jgi:hypothetical protein
VLMPVTREYGVPLMVARGYSSETFAYNAADAMRETGKACYVYYVGDFDPSGWQIARSLERKLAEFGAPVVFERLAVNPEQIQAWDLPTRRSKVSDTRCKAFFAEFGDGTESVELDAIHPDLLRGLVRDAVEQHVDHGQLVRSIAARGRRRAGDFARAWGHSHGGAGDAPVSDSRARRGGVTTIQIYVRLGRAPEQRTTAGGKAMVTGTPWPAASSRPRKPNPRRWSSSTIARPWRLTIWNGGSPP